jgi:hypothetical protein
MQVDTTRKNPERNQAKINYNEGKLFESVIQ